MVSWVPCLPPAVSGSGARCGRVCWARVSPVLSPSWLGCRGVFFFFLRFDFFFSFFFFFWALWSLSLHPLSFGLGWWLSFFFFFFVSLFPVVRCYWLGVAGFGWVVPLCLCGGPPFFFFFFFPGGGAWPPVVVLAGGWAAVGCFRAFSPSPLLFFFFFGLCTGWARRPFLLGQVLALPVGRLRQAAACGFGLGGWGCSCPYPSAVPAVIFWVVRHRCRLARCGPRVWPVVLVCGVVARRLPGCAAAGFG